MKNKLLHIVDMQNDFVLANGKLAVAGSDALIKPANDFLQNSKFDKTIATFDTHYKNSYVKSDEGKQFPVHCVYGTKGWKLAIKIPQYTPVLKGKFSVWDNPKDIESVLNGFAPENTDIFVFGVASDFCVRYAIDGYLKRGYNVTIISDLCRGIVNQIDDVAKDFRNKNLQMITTKEFEGR
ncbi:MAG: isochorismatase family protein [Rickettsiales bacterium]|jgi:nicotinamidase/pyrazinamidase|nr:isochorismatase family protein [Rickettsiales bacterium]